MRLMMLIAMVTVMAGCSTGGGQYANPDDDVFGSKDRLAYPQKSRAVVEMVERMVTDPDFKDIYNVALERAKKRGHARPTVVIGTIEDNTKAGVSDARSTGPMRKELKTTLRKTRMFAVIDFYEREKMKGSAITEVNGGAKSDNAESVGEYESGDIFMSGELTKDEANGRHYHFFNLRLDDPVTGGEIWSDTVKVAKE